MMRKKKVKASWWKETDELKDCWILQLNHNPAVRRREVESGADMGLFEVWKRSDKVVEPTKLMRTNKGRWSGYVAGAWEDLCTDWVNVSFTPAFLKKCIDNATNPVQIPVGRTSSISVDSREPPGDSSTKSTPYAFGSAVVEDVLPPRVLNSFPQGDENACVAYAAAAALKHMGAVDTSNQPIHDHIKALHDIPTSDRLRELNKSFDSIPGWSTKFVHGYDPLTHHCEGPVITQFMASDGYDRHCFVVVGGLIFDGNHTFALPLTKTSMDACCVHAGTVFAHVQRALHLVPGKRVTELMRINAAGELNTHCDKKQRID